ncbi:MAG TPA: DUF3015 family protein [Nitrospira sp.]|nr:DUF3015 family protein [Nitrospira sp.]
MLPDMARRVFTACGVIIIGANLAACNTTKATIDTTVNFFSSTTPNSLFTEDGLVKQEQKINLFAGVAYENLRQEAAAGSGQYVTSLASLYGVPEVKHAAFGSVLQQRHAELFAADLREDNRAHLKMVSVLNRVLSQEPSLTQ